MKYLVLATLVERSIFYNLSHSINRKGNIEDAHMQSEKLQKIVPFVPEEGCGLHCRVTERSGFNTEYVQSLIPLIKNRVTW